MNEEKSTVIIIIIMKRAVPSMAYIENSLSSDHLYPKNPMISMDWDLQSLGVFSSDMSLETESPFSSDGSTGYLEDAIADYWNSRNKRPRTSSYSHDQMIHQDLDDDDHAIANPFMICTSMATQFVADDYLINNQLSTPTERDTAPTTKQGDLYSSSSSSHSQIDSSVASKNSDASVSEEGHSRKIVYPFNLVKPGGVEGDVTLQDINRRLLKRPSKPVRHPVGHFATHPCISSGGLGMSGKAVVALTKIQTQGRGTITIFRTKG